MNMTTIRLKFRIVATKDLDLERAFRHGDLDEENYMEQLEDFASFGH